LPSKITGMVKISAKASLKKKYHVLRANATIQARMGAAVRVCRHNLGITQEELAWRAELHRTYIADIERGARNVTLQSIANLSSALQITIENLFAHVTAPHGAAALFGTVPVMNEVREILLVEHDAAAAATTARAFKRAKLANPLRIFRDGETGLDYLFGTGPHSKRKPVRPQLILLVLDLPRMSGLQFMRRVKRDERTRHIPIVLLAKSQ
jgi:CheY-like chemotaxis protein/DNA-binding XRE family transcriptional regulator